MIFTDLNRLFTRRFRLLRLCSALPLFSFAFSQALAQSAPSASDAPQLQYDDCMKEAARLKEVAKKAELSTMGYISVGFFGFGNGYANAYQDAANAAAAKLSECGSLLTSLQLDSPENLASFDGSAKDLMADNTRVGDGANNVVKTLPYVDAGIYAVGGAGMVATGVGGVAYGAGALASSLAIGGGLGLSIGAAGEVALIADEAAKNPNRMPQINHYAVGGSAGLGAALGGLFPLVAGSAAIVGTAGYGSAVVASTESLAHYLDGEYYQSAFQAVNALAGFVATPYAVSNAREAEVMAVFERVWAKFEAPPGMPKFGVNREQFLNTYSENGMIDDSGPYVFSFRAASQRALKTLLGADEIPSGAKRLGTLDAFADDFSNPEELSKLMAAHMDSSAKLLPTPSSATPDRVHWSPFVGTSDRPQIAGLYGKPGDVLMVIKSPKEASLRNPHNFGPGTEGERLFPGVIPEAMVTRAYQLVARDSNGNFLYQLKWIQNQGTGRLEIYTPSKPGLGFMTVPANGR